MTYSRRNFLKAAGSGIVLTAVGGEAIPAALAAPLAASPMTREKASFLINGRPLVAEYEARTTLWEVIAVQLGLTGTNRSCNKASCGACSVLVDGTPFYSCHTLALGGYGQGPAGQKSQSFRTRREGCSGGSHLPMRLLPGDYSHREGLGRSVAWRESRG